MRLFAVILSLFFMTGCVARLIQSPQRDPIIVRDILDRHALKIEDHQVWQLDSHLNVEESQWPQGMHSERIQLLLPPCEEVSGYLDREWWRSALSFATLTLYPFKKTLKCPAVLKILGDDGREKTRFEHDQLYGVSLGFGPALGAAYGYSDDRTRAVEALFRQLYTWEKEGSR